MTPTVILSLCTSLFSAGYNWRKVDITAEASTRVEKRVEAIEDEVIQSKLATRDIEWIKQSLRQNEKQHAQILQILQTLEMRNAARR